MIFKEARSCHQLVKINVGFSGLLLANGIQNNETDAVHLFCDPSLDIPREGQVRRLFMSKCSVFLKKVVEVFLRSRSKCRVSLLPVALEILMKVGNARSFRDGLRGVCHDHQTTPQEGFWEKFGVD